MNNTQSNKQERSNKPKQNNRNSNNRNNNRNRYKRSPKDQDRHLDQDNRDLLKKLRFVSYQFVSFVEHSTEEQLLWSQSPEAWNIKHQIGHICQYVDFQTKKISAIISEESFELSFNKDDAIKEEEFNNRSLENLLSRFRKIKRSLFSPLYASQNEDWLKELEIDSEKISLKSLINEINNYFDLMLDDIFLNLQRHKVWYIPEEATELDEEQSKLSDNDSPKPEEKDKSEVLAESNELDKNEDEIS